MPIDLEAFHNEAEVAIGDDFTLRMVIDMGVIDRLELLTNRRMDGIIGDLMNSTSVMVKVLWGVTRPHHSDLTMDQVAGLLLPKDATKKPVAMAVAATLGDLVRRTFHIGAEEGEESRPPPKRSTGASRASARSGLRQASSLTPSGKRRRARS